MYLPTKVSIGRGVLYFNKRRRREGRKEGAYTLFPLIAYCLISFRLPYLAGHKLRQNECYRISPFLVFWGDLCHIGFVFRLAFRCGFCNSIIRRVSTFLRILRYGRLSPMTAMWMKFVVIAMYCEFDLGIVWKYIKITRLQT